MDCGEARLLLHAYLDGETDLAASLDVERHLEDCPACTRDMANFRAARETLVSQAPYYSAPAALERRLRRLIRSKGSHAPSRRLSAPQPRIAGWPLGAATACAALLLVIAVLRIPQHAPDVTDPMVRDAVADHVRGLVAGRLTDVVSSSKHVVKPWFAGKLDFSPIVVDLATQGSPLIGGRVDYLGDRTVAALVYRHGRHLITLFTWPAEAQGESPVSTGARKGFNYCNWMQSGMWFWSVSDMNAQELRAFAGQLRLAVAAVNPTTVSRQK